MGSRCWNESIGAWQKAGTFLCWSASYLAAERQSIVGKLMGHIAAGGMHPLVSLLDQFTQCVRFVYDVLCVLFMQPSFHGT